MQCYARRVFETGKSWFISWKGEQLGPYSWETLVRQARKGTLNPKALIWSEGMDSWKPADSVGGLFAAPDPLRDNPPPPPVRPRTATPDRKRAACS